jgi:muramoyltetrapeptide carboxypeptidase
MRRSYRLRWVLEDRLAGLGIPVIYGAPIGHETNKITLPLGIRAILETEKPGLTLLEPAVS